MENQKVVKRKDLIGKTGEVIKEFEIVDANQTGSIVNIRVQEEDGEVYWTSIDDSGVTIFN
ncbi:hypothetical protein MOE23_06730 [Bacillus haynesii]|uniref:hypothetical protein n=1 Tax=Bacillus haynesii TaxID=1925021 RepID=UPI001C241BEB|nr:hypothetical protein [Bacillus haynesii]MBU8684390.1 hypothetical protein [Bacillus haynesii]MCY8068438.1 hypothetical protein [Bacillus haynesii]MCY8579917.1 hypothetical protein [Bacillus haynesii]